MLPTPPLDPESAPFYEAAKDGRFLIRRCTRCKEPHWYPRSLCPFCFSPTDWEEASGRGTLMSYSSVPSGDDPYVLAFVQLEEGPAMLTNIVNCPPERLVVGMDVAVSWVDAGSEKAPCFTPTAHDRN